MEEGTEFGFGSGGKDLFHYVEDRAIENVGLGLVAKVEMAALTTAGTNSIEIRGVAMEFEYHVAGVIMDGAIWVRGTVIKELLTGTFGCVSCCGLGRREFTEGS